MIIDKNDKHYRQCSLTVMDNIADPGIQFDEKGVCNYANDFFLNYEANVPKDGAEQLSFYIDKIKKEGKNKPYDCITGISGGVDSSYLIYKAKEWGLRPLIVHFDNGWNSEIAVRNINNIISKTGFELFTLVVNWEEFKDLQLSYIKAGVVDLEVPTDHAIYATWFKLSRKFKINYVLNGNNYITESIMPGNWLFNKADAVNLKNIHKQFGKKKLKTYPLYQPAHHLLYKNLLNIQDIKPLNLISYNKEEVKKILKEELSWMDYGGKHYESMYTKFYQAYILPEKFKIDKRKPHLSNLILAGQLTKAEAMIELEKPLYLPHELKEDKEYFIKKMEVNIEFLEDYIKKERVPHELYGTQKFITEMYPMLKFIRPLYHALKKK